jgi:hypothetical protein
VEDVYLFFGGVGVGGRELSVFSCQFSVSEKKKAYHRGHREHGEKRGGRSERVKEFKNAGRISGGGVMEGLTPEGVRYRERMSYRVG